MSGPLDEPEDATPLTPEECEGLIPSHVTLRGELNELEQQNILGVLAPDGFRQRSFRTRPSSPHVRRCMALGWDYRTSNKNLGVERAQIYPRLYEAFDQVRYWVEHKTFPPDEIAIRLHHALVIIHPFPNGNGRWSRLMADILVVRLGQRPLHLGPKRFARGR
jgi:Fic-DOC domain mobile mystery protein B